MYFNALSCKISIYDLLVLKVLPHICEKQFKLDMNNDLKIKIQVFKFRLIFVFYYNST